MIEPQPEPGDTGEIALSLDADRLQAEIQADNLIDDLRARLADENVDWRRTLFEIMAEWPLAGEQVDDREFVYLIGGEAFDWRALAERLMNACGDAISLDNQERLLLGPDPPPEISDDEFSRMLGVEKQRGHLNYLYGVTAERGLILAVEEAIRKRRVARGYSPSDDRIEDAYVNLYRATQEELLKEYRRELTPPEGKPPASGELTLTLIESDAFTYWLFKRRFKLSEPARLASDTRKALEQLERMRAAHRRREAALRIFRAQEAGRTVDGSA
ncbi:MAG: hypothetical protein IH961_09760 [Chloroflexi bacterium]|nr:hypothetical protein [Chloroflexota bacterium]